MIDSTAQIIVAVGIACLLATLGGSVIIWTLRCDPKRAHYRLPALIGLALPASITILWSVTRLS